MTNKMDSILTILGVSVIGSIMVGVYHYGRYKYYCGRVSKYRELKPLINGLQNTNERLMNKLEA